MHSLWETATIGHKISSNFLLRFNALDRKSTRLNSSHDQISYAVFCLKKKKDCSFCYWPTGKRTHGGRGQRESHRARQRQGRRHRHGPAQGTSSEAAEPQDSTREKLTAGPRSGWGGGLRLRERLLLLGDWRLALRLRCGEGGRSGRPLGCRPR